jgi:NAD(P)-dependent dehydrogenase (short-subunit alcohol dehydrogenase family)
MGRLDDRVALVTGAASGIGEATTARFRDEGAVVATLDLQGDVDHALDVRDEAAVEAAVRAVVDRAGRIDVVVNAAGVAGGGPVHLLPADEWDRVVDVNLKGTFLVTRAFLPAMRQAGAGRFVAIGSISSTLGTPSLTAYCAAKWGVLGFTKALAEELRGSGLQTMCVLPGSTDTEMLRGSGFPPQMRPEDVAGTVVYAALDAPDAMNGGAIEVFGP